MNEAVFQGDYTDLKFIKTRSACQVIIEIPIEQASAFVAAFGAPVPSSGCPVAIARILPSLVRQQLEASVALIDKPDGGSPETLRYGNKMTGPTKERRSWSALSYAEQAGIRCNEPDFLRFLNHSCGDQSASINSAESAATFVRGYCNVISRSDIKPGTEFGDRWTKLSDKYDSWKQRPTF